MARQPDRQQRVEEILERVRHELDGVNSIRSEVAQRVAATSIKSSRPMLVGAAAVLVVVTLALVGWMRFNTIAPRVPLGSGDQTAAIDSFKLEIDQAELVQHVAALVDHAVVVVWSYRGQGVTADQADAAEQRVGKYRLITLRQATLADGRTVTCSLFIPDQDVRPILEPPCLFARSADRRRIALSASPRVVSAAEFADAIRSAGLAGPLGLGMDDVNREIQKRVN